MSGGHWDYQQHRITNIIECMEEDIGNTESIDGNVDTEMKRCIHYLNLAKIYMQRLDYLYSADDGIVEFHNRLKEDLDKYLKDLK